MSAGFGFSVGDFIAGIQLVRDVITSLQASSGSSSAYKALIMELFSLERALLEVKALKRFNHTPDQVDALKCAASQCQLTIDRFMTKVQKYQPSLNAQGSGSKRRDSLRKVQWALCKKEDVASFKAEISGHAIAINLPIATAQFNATTSLTNRSERRHEEHQEATAALAAQISWPTLAMNSVKTGIEPCLRQGQELLAISKNILQTNLRIFRAVSEIQVFIASIPAQVLRQQPIYFTDAHGLEVPFHLEFVYSREVLHDWLLRRFPNDREKIEHGEFALQDLRTKRRLALDDQWVTLFHPGMKVAMDIIYNFHAISRFPLSMCPGCGADSASSDEKGLCSNCGTYYTVAPESIRAYVAERIPFVSWRGEPPDLSRFRRVRIEFPSSSMRSPPNPPLWLSTAVDELQRQYPDDSFYLQMVFSTIDGFDQTVRNVHRDLPWPPGTKGTFLPHILCEECEDKVGFWPRNRAEVGDFEVHLKSPAHRQFVENRKTSSIGAEYSINSWNSRPGPHRNTEHPFEPTARGSPDGWEDASPPWSPLTQRQPGDSPRKYPPERSYPDKMEEELDDLVDYVGAGSLGVLEGEGFGHHIYGKGDLGRVGNSRKRGISPSSSNSDVQEKKRPMKRRRSKRLAQKK
ncbi:hypothetical protein V8E51_019767 [Hyaloscypha variabilis]